MLREQTIILGNRSITLNHVAPNPMTFTSRQELKKHLKANELYSPYFS